jgi:hypothetical protein
VGAERAAHSRHRVAAAVAAGTVFELEDVAIVDAGVQQRARRAEAGDAGADDDRADAPRQRDLGRAARLRRGPAAAQQVAALGVGADPAASCARRVVARAGGERRQGGERRGEDVAARRPRASAARTAHRCTLPHSSSKVWTRTWFERRLTSAGTRAMSGGKSNSAGKPATVTKRSPAAAPARGETAAGWRR